MRIYKKPLVSVVMPSYNHVDFVSEAIESVLRQTFADFEFIIVDDGSTDGTGKVIKRFRDSRIKFIPLQNNKQFHPRNLAVNRARGRYIAFQNSDDVWQADKLAKQLEAIKAHKNVVACLTGVEIISTTGNRSRDNWANSLFKTHNKTSDEWLKYFFEIGNCLCISSALVKRSAIKKVGVFDESLVQLSDFDLWIRLAAKGELHILSEKLTKMRIVKGKNVSTPTPPHQRRTTLEFAQVLERYINCDVDLHKVFPNAIGAANLPRVIELAHLAQYSWNMTSAHKLFSQRLLAELFTNTVNRNLITSHFGPKIYHDFASKRSQLEIKVYE